MTLARPLGVSSLKIVSITQLVILLQWEIVRITKGAFFLFLLHAWPTSSDSFKLNDIE